MNRVLAAGLLAVLLALPLASAPAAADDRYNRDYSRDVPVVEGPIDMLRVPGGQAMHVRIGDIRLGVIWSTNASAGMSPALYLDYLRFLGGAELYDEQGTYLRTIGLPVHTRLQQHFDRIVEFRDMDNDTRFDFDLRVENRTDFRGDLPLKVLGLQTAWQLDGPVEKLVTDTAAWVNFTISAVNVSYREVFDTGIRLWRRAVAADGVLDKIGFTFRLAATKQNLTADVPFYRITIANGNEREPMHSEFLENRTVAGTSFSVNGKYDQRIEGWDFGGFANAKLALGTGLAFGNYYSRPIVHWLQQQFGGACLKDGSFEHCESETGPTQPVVIARDHLQIAEGWHRAGDWYWTSDVTVDGQPATMTFEIYHAEQGRELRDAGGFFDGFRSWGAFVYPQGQVIVHDPGLRATSVLSPISETTNPTPSILVGLQLAVVGLALVPAIFLRWRARKERR